MNGLIGLTKNVDKRQAAQQELAVLETMENRQAMEQQQELQAQQMQEAMYERMYAQADQMLEKDRKKINQRIQLAQRQVREHLDRTGGSKKDFLANGGLSVMNEISNGIIRSDEAVQYQENKKNLARILEAKEKGMGHLLSPNDLKSLEDYEKNENGGRITYSGLMAEIEIPHDKFALGQEIHPAYIANHNANMVKLMGNYATVYPDKPLPETDPETGQLTRQGQAQMAAFMKKMGYGGMGQNAQIMKNQIAMQKAAAKDKAKSEKKTAIHTLDQMRHMLGDVTYDQIANHEGDFMAEQLKKDGNSAFRAFLGEPLKAVAQRRGLSDPNDASWYNVIEGVSEVIDYVGQPEMGLKGGYKIALTQNDQNLIAQEVLGVIPEEGTLKGFNPSGDMYRADGTKLNKGDNDDYEGDWKIAGISSALKTAVNNGGGEDEEVLVMDVYDGGKVDKEASKKLYVDSEGNPISSPVQMTYTVALENEAGDLVYKEIDMESPAIVQALSNAMPNNDYTDIYEQDRESNKKRMQVKALQAEEQVEFENTLKRAEAVFEDPMFKEEGEQYYGAGSAGSRNRYDMMKSFYAAYEYIGSQQIEGEEGEKKGGNPKVIQNLVDKNAFTAVVGSQVEEDLLDYKKNPDIIIDKWMEESMKDLDPQSDAAQNVYQTAYRWKQILGIL